jgi:hypothetical protein
MNEKVDIAVDLGVLGAPLPQIETHLEFVLNPQAPPPQIIGGILHQGCKMVLGGTSKSNKSWCLLDLAISVASGQPWWGHPCTRSSVLYINFELHRWALAERIHALATARPECRDVDKTLHWWNLRGRNADMTVLRPKLEEQIARRQFGLIILDPAYKVLGDRDENANGDIASLMNEFEGLATSSGASVVVCHHFAKGDSTAKNAMDRLSGAGAWVRDPDSIRVLTPHEEPDCFTVSTILRNLPLIPEFVVSWEFPLMRVAPDLNPEALRRPQVKNKVCSDREFVEQLLTETPTARSFLVAKGAELGISPRTIDRYLARLAEANIIGSEYGLYWRKG